MATTELKESHGQQTNSVSDYGNDELSLMPMNQTENGSPQPIQRMQMVDTANSTAKMPDDQMIVEHPYMQTQDVVPVDELQRRGQIGDVKVEHAGSRRSLHKMNSIFSKDEISIDNNSDSLNNASTLNNRSQEARITAKAIANYQRKKRKHFKTSRVFNDDMIAQLDKETTKRTDLIASLLGNSKEARDIQNQFKKMIEVPQEDFNIDNYKTLSTELKIMQRPDKVYEKQLKINPRLQKKMTQIEDFVHILPTSAESKSRMSDNDPKADHHKHDSLYQSSSVSRQDSQQLLALQDDPEKEVLAIQYITKKASAPQIQTLQTNLNNAVEVEDQAEDADENTFITNLVEENFQQPQSQLGTLPNIRMKNQDLLTSNEVSIVQQDHEDDIKQNSVQFTNEYQLIPLKGDKRAKFNSIQDYRSTSTIARDSIMTQASSKIVSRRKQNIGNVTSSLSTLPYSREHMLREPSELSFTAGHRKPLKSLGSKRILGDKNGFIHSSLSSALGRESRVLKRIYDRVKKIEKNQEQRSKNSVNDILWSHRNEGTRTAGSRKQSMPIASEFSIAQGRPSSLEPMNLMTEQSSTKQLIEHEPSATTLLNPSAAKTPTMDTNLQVFIVDTAMNPIMRVQGDYLNLDSEGRVLSTQQFEGQRDSKESQQSEIQQMMQYQQLDTLDKTTPNVFNQTTSKYMTQQVSGSAENVRLDSQKRLNQYKQRRILVGNAQLSKLIKKDMKMFTGGRSARKQRESRKSSMSSIKQTLPPIGGEKNSMLDEDVSEDNTASIEVLQSRPLGYKDSVSDETLVSERKVETALMPESVHIPVVSSQDLLGSEPSNEQIVLTEPKIQFADPLIDNKRLSNDSIVVEVTQTSLDNRTPNKESLFKDRVAAKIQTIKQERTVRLQKEVTQYYKNMNAKMRSSTKKLGKVLIQGRQIVEPNGSQLSSAQSQHATMHLAQQDPNATAKSEIIEDRIATLVEQSEKTERYDESDPRGPVSLQVSGNFEKPPNRRKSTDVSPDYTDRQMGSSGQNRQESGAVTSLGQLQQRVIKDHMNQIMRGSQNVSISKSVLSIEKEKAHHSTSYGDSAVPNHEQMVTIGNESSGSHILHHQQRGDSLVTTAYLDPYASHNGTQFKAMYEDQLQKGVQVLEQKKNVKGRKDPVKPANKVTHQVQITSPFQYSGLPQQPEIRFIEGQPTLPARNSDSNSNGTLEKVVSSQAFTPHNGQIVSQINLNAHFDLQAIQNVSQQKSTKFKPNGRSNSQEFVKKTKNQATSVQSIKRPSNQDGQSATAISVNNVQLQVNTFDRQVEADIAQLNQTQGTLQNRSTFQKHSNQAESDFDHSSPPTIKIKMVLTNEKGIRNSRGQYSQDPPRIEERTIIETEGQEMAPTEREQEPLTIVAKRASVRKSHLAFKTNDTAENIDLLPVIRDHTMNKDKGGNRSTKNSSNK